VNLTSIKDRGGQVLNIRNIEEEGIFAWPAPCPASRGRVACQTGAWLSGRYEWDAGLPTWPA